MRTRGYRGAVGKKQSRRDGAIAKLRWRITELSRRPMVRLHRLRALVRSGVRFVMHSAIDGMKKRGFAGTVAVGQVRLIGLEPGVG